MQNFVDPTLAQNMSNAEPYQQVDALFNYMRVHGQTFYDEVVTQLEHALQCAALAVQNQAGNTLVTSALLHDIGHFVLDEHDADVLFLESDLNHEEVGAKYLEPFFPEAVTTPIRLHVPAKRYLCTVDVSYYDGLSNASQRSLKLQGDSMTAEECRAFEEVSHYQDALTLRRWDDQAKVKGVETDGLETYQEIVRLCLK